MLLNTTTSLNTFLYSSGKVSFGTCSTAAATTNKEVIIPNINLEKGGVYAITFSNANTATTPTLSISGSSAKNIYSLKGTQFTTGQLFTNKAGETVIFTYDGTNIVLLTAPFYSSKLAMPSASSVDITLDVSGSSYTAVSDGYVSFNKTSSASGQRIALTNGYGAQQSWSSDTSQFLTVMIPAKQGDIVYYYYTAGGATNWFKFIKTVGSS